jgi:EAL domain-containing protein (putative c-di-GMP-specific phosphodiesterase class I)
VEREFRETDEIRRQALQELREWAVKNPRIEKMRLDANFLLRFLRSKKFSLPMVKEILERYLVLRFFVHEGKEVFRNLDVRDSAVQELLDLG